ncbi:TetR/AcrR family transcriptional regulator [Streptomyces sp. TR1341]|uniref:TetR-like C-terminal domain-containing protein n=1 Tax=Streptomyces TaxID=1883 RepID=UPI00138AE935|nr:TetR-like C-terminal domain-containing protein [Streptomyces murinus]NDK29177.1 TetR/AcrR family transcriptional regulator [Streptomyces sp. TR1341]
MAETFKRRAPSQWGEGGALKEEILAAAARLLAESGREEALSLRAVAREVGIAAPSVYLHFKDRSELVATVTRRAYEKLVAELREARDGGTPHAPHSSHAPHTSRAPHTPRTALRAMAHRYCTFALENPRRFRLMFGVERIVGPREDSPRHPVWLVLGAWEEALAALPADRSGQVGAEQDALLLWSALHGIVTIAMALPYEVDRRGLIQRADDLLDRIVAG